MSDDKTSADLDLLRKLAEGTGGRRTGALMREGYIRVEVTDEGRAALRQHAAEQNPLRAPWTVEVEKNPPGPHSALDALHCVRDCDGSRLTVWMSKKCADAIAEVPDLRRICDQLREDQEHYESVKTDLVAARAEAEALRSGAEKLLADWDDVPGSELQGLLDRVDAEGSLEHVESLIEQRQRAEKAEQERDTWRAEEAITAGLLADEKQRAEKAEKLLQAERQSNATIRQQLDDVERMRSEVERLRTALQEKENDLSAEILRERERAEKAEAEVERLKKIAGRGMGCYNRHPEHVSSGEHGLRHPGNGAPWCNECQEYAWDYPERTINRVTAERDACRAAMEALDHVRQNGGKGPAVLVVRSLLSDARDLLRRGESGEPAPRLPDCAKQLTITRDHHAFRGLHAVYHERDFRVRVNDPTIQMVRQVLAECLGRAPKTSGTCPACAAGFDFEWPTRGEKPLFVEQDEARRGESGAPTAAPGTVCGCGERAVLCRHCADLNFGSEALSACIETLRQYADGENWVPQDGVDEHERLWLWADDGYGLAQRTLAKVEGGGDGE